MVLFMGVSFNFLIIILIIMMRKVSVLTLALLFGLLNAEKQLKFNSNGKFKMVQFTDIHFGETHDADVKN